VQRSTLGACSPRRPCTSATPPIKQQQTAAWWC
jgi:hypothetical protein